MLSRLRYYLFPIFLTSIFTSTSVSATTCSYSEQKCYSSSSYDSWCCPSYKYCGDYYYSCLDYPTSTPSNSSDGLSPAYYVTFLILFFICALCRFMMCCNRSQPAPQRTRSNVIARNAQIPSYPYQQQPVRGSTRAVRVRPVYNVNAAPPVPSVHEAPPPPYEVAIATRDLPPKYQAESSPPATATIDQTYLRV